MSCLPSPLTLPASRSIIALLALALTCAPALAADKAVTSVAEADADYALQGEFAGMLPGEGRVGLQVVAMGGGKFDAVLLRGGLPGAGWDKTSREKLSGERNDSGAKLTGPQHTITIQGSQATVASTAGAMLGRLAKIHRISPTMGLPPAPQATVLFANGKAHELQNARVTADGLLEVDTTTKMPVQDFRLHLEFRTPYQPTARGQGRGNSGVYIQRRYEVQILDSFGLPGEFNECGSLYRQTPPDINMALPPLVWQTYDIWFTPASFDAEGKKTKNARITVWHNGVPVHDNREITSKTGAGQAETDKPLPIHLQQHGNPVHFRNLWIVLGPVVHPAEEPVVTAPVCQPCEPCPRVCRPCRIGILRRLIGRCR
jgi:hypothetical protein